MSFSLALPDPQLIWGLVSRSVGLLFLIAHASLAPQLLSIMGRKGVLPLAPRLAQQAKDTPSWRRFFHTPTVFWLSTSDRLIRIVPLIGMFGGALAVYGGEAGFWGLLLAWMCYLSIEQTAATIFPWDTMLLEVGFLALFLPEALPLPALEASALPLPAVAFSFRWLLARLMLGFGRVKFVGSRKEDNLYLRGFLSWLPMPTPLGWYLQHAPAWVLRLSLYFMFFSEVCAPILALISGVPRLIGFACLTGLMVGIHLTGNWGFFNIGYALLCLVFLDIDSSIFDIAAPGALAGTTEVLAVNIVMGVLFLLTLPYLLLESWTTRSWVGLGLDWITVPRPWLRRSLSVLRAIAPFRIVSGYGVFPPQAYSPVRMTMVFEGSADGKVWQAYRYRYLPSEEHDAPSIVAPHHPRSDQMVPYVVASSDGSMLGVLMGDGSPYTNYRVTSWPKRVMQSLLRGDAHTTELFVNNPFKDAPPRYMRASVYALAPASIAEKRRSGRWWMRRRVGSLFPTTMGLDAYDSFDKEPVPELFHPDALESKRRCPVLEDIRVAAKRSSLDEAVLVGGDDMTAADVERFWSEFVPFVHEQMGQWDTIRERVGTLRARYAPEQLFRFERLLERYAWILSEYVEQHAFGLREPALPPKLTTFQRHLLIQQAVLEGREALAAYCADAAPIVERQKSLTKEVALYPLALLRWEAIDFHIRSFRWVQMTRNLRDQGLPGISEFYDMLSAQKPTEEDWVPVYHKQPDGEWIVPGLIDPASDDPELGSRVQGQLG